MKRQAIWSTMGLAIMVAGIEAAACSKNESTAPSVQAVQSAQEPAAGVTKVIVTENGFVPSSVTTRRGSDLTLEFIRTTDSTCATKVVFPELGLTRDLPRGAPVQVHVPTDQARTLAFQCGMGMYKSSVVIR